jgi:ferredoxin
MATIYFKSSNKKVEWQNDGEANLLRESIRHDAGVPYRCGGGLCGTCRVFIESGRENLSKVRKPEIAHLGDEVEKGYRLACQTFTRGDCTLSWDPEKGKGTASQKLKEYWMQKA